MIAFKRGLGGLLWQLVHNHDPGIQVSADLGSTRAIPNNEENEGQ